MTRLAPSWKGTIGKAEFEIASEPSAGFSTLMETDLEEEFDKRTIPIDGVDTIKLTAQE